MAKTKAKTTMSMGSISKRYEELTFADDFMFGKVMEDKDLCREVLECLLQEPVGELTDMQTQRQFCYTKDGKPIRLDLYAGNEETMYDAEMQQLNQNKIGYAYSTPLPLIHEGWGFLFATFSFIIVL